MEMEQSSALSKCSFLIYITSFSNNLWKKLLLTWGDPVLSIRIWKWNMKWRKDSILDQRVAVGWCNIWLALAVWHLGFLFQWPLWWRCCVSPWLTHILIMLTCTLTTNQYYYSCFSVHTRYIVLNISSFSHSHPNTSGVDHSDAELWHLHALPNLGILFNCLAFPKVTTFTCSFGACDVNVSLFNMSFCGADVRGPGLVGAARHRQSILSRPSVNFSACHSFDHTDLICDPAVYSTGCRITVPADLWRDVLVHSKAIGTKAREKKHSKTADPKFLTVNNSILFFCFSAVWLFTMHSSVCTFTAESRSVLCSNNLP